MKIEKGKLYYDALCREIFKVDEDSYSNYNVSDKIAVHCPTKDDWDYVNKVMGWEWDFSRNHVYRLLDNETFRMQDLQDAIRHKYHIITIDQFKEFYPEDQKEPSLPIVDNTNIDNIIEALKIQTQLDYSIEAIERELSRLKELKQKIKNILK